MAGAGLSFRFECVSEAGALLVLMDCATKSSVELSDIFEDYMLRNHESWYSFARNPRTLGKRCVREDIILVRGTIKTSSWAIAAFFDGGSQTHEVAFNGQFGEVASAGLKYSQSRGTICSFERRVSSNNPALHARDQHLPSPSTNILDINDNILHSFDHDDHPMANADQCVFLNYYKMKRRIFRTGKLIANGELSGPSGYSDSGGDGHYLDVGMEVQPDVDHDGVSPSSPSDEGITNLRLVSLAS